MRKKVKLTISILISKRPDTVRKCLDSIKPILEQVDSELILTDTGCGEEVRSIIEEYTDHILDFEWCRDFSKARNLGLQEARGEWFLFLDDDEWFEDVSDIIKFFNSGEYKKYGIAVYYQRNYGDEQGLEYEDLAVGRMIKLEPDIHFKYAIHECFNRVPGKTKILNAYVHHYGYVYKSEQARIAHSERNISLLLIEHEKDPHNLKHILQLVQEYNSIEKYEESFELSLKGIEYDKKGVTTESFCRNSLFVNVINCFIRQEKYKEIIETGDRYLQEENLDELAKAIIYFRLAASYFEIKEYTKALEAVLEYWKRYECQLENPEVYVAYITTVTSAAFRPGYLNIVACLAVRICMAMGDYKQADMWLERLDLESKNLILMDTMIDEILGNYVKEQGEAHKYLLNMCHRLLKRKELESYIILYIEKACYEEQNRSKEEAILMFYGLESESPFFKMISFLYDVKKGKGVEALTEEFKCLCKENLKACFRSFIVYRVWQQAKESGIDVEDVIQNIRYSIWDKAVTSYCSYPLIEEMDKFHSILSEFMNPDEIHMLSWNKSYFFYKLQQQADVIKKKSALDELEMKQEAEELTKELLEKLTLYSDVCIKLYSRIYRPEILSIDIGILPKEGQAGFYLAKWNKAMEIQQLVEAVSIIKEAKEEIPEWGQIFQICLKKVEKESQEQKKAQDEFYILGCQLKRKAKECIQLGQKEMAKMILLQLKSMLPEDIEIDNLLAEIL